MTSLPRRLGKWYSFDRLTVFPSGIRALYSLLLRISINSVASTLPLIGLS